MMALPGSHFSWWQIFRLGVVQACLPGFIEARKAKDTAPAA